MGTFILIMSNFARANSLPEHPYRSHPVCSAIRGELQYRLRWFQAVE
jgi:hypothetical protein